MREIQTYDEMSEWRSARQQIGAISGNDLPMEIDNISEICLYRKYIDGKLSVLITLGDETWLVQDIESDITCFFSASSIISAVSEEYHIEYESYTIDEFIRGVKSGAFSLNDGEGYYGNEEFEDPNAPVDFQIPLLEVAKKQYTTVYWYNK